MSSQETTWAQPPSSSPSTGFRPQPSLTPNASSWSEVVDGILAGEALSVQHMFLLLCQWLGEMGVKVSLEKGLEVPTSAASHSVTPRHSPAPLKKELCRVSCFGSSVRLGCSCVLLGVWWCGITFWGYSLSLVLVPAFPFLRERCHVFLCASTLVVDDTG